MTKINAENGREIFRDVSHNSSVEEYFFKINSSSLVNKERNKHDKNEDFVSEG